MKLTIIMPVYNEKNTFNEILKKVKKVRIKIQKEIIIVDDGSRDGTRELIEKVKGKGIKKFFHKKNTGKGAAISTAIKNADGDIIIIQDADLEYNPEDYGRVIEPILKGEARVVYGERFTLNRLGRWAIPSHFIGNKFLSFLTGIIFLRRVRDMETCYKAFKKDVIKNIKINSKRFDVEPEITAKILRRGIKIYEVPIHFHPRTFKEGKKINWRDGLIAIWTLIKYRFED